MTNKTKTIELKKRAHKDTILYLEEKKRALTFQLHKNRREIKYLADSQRTFKKGIFYLINLIRLQSGKDPFTWSEKKRKVIRRSKEKNTVIPAFLVAASKKESFKILRTCGTFDEAEELINRLDLYAQYEPAIVKIHNARIILID